MHCFKVPGRLRTDSEEEITSLSLKSEGKGETNVNQESLIKLSSDASSRKSNFSLRVNGGALGRLRTKKKISQLNNLATDLQPIQEMHNENRGANKNRVDAD